jgi:GT2 family glycosyltransferase
MLSVIVLSYNRGLALAKTLRELELILSSIGAASEIIVVDNASTDGSVEMVRRDFPSVRLLPLPANVGVAAFNRGADLAKGDFLLILDDDSWPDAASLKAAFHELTSNDALAGVALLPIHPATGVVEWSFLDHAHANFPVMGCGNLVRAKAWREVGGYEESFFLYRNDTDLAMKLLAAGRDVLARPDWIVWHDSPHAARKSDRWLHLATRNWMLLARRHARGWRLPLAMLLGWIWACCHAGPSAHRLLCATRGAWAGLTTRVPPMPASVRPTGSHFAALLRLQLRSRGRTPPRTPLGSHADPAAATTASSIPRHSP